MSECDEAVKRLYKLIDESNARKKNLEQLIEAKRAEAIANIKKAFKPEVAHG